MPRRFMLLTVLLCAAVPAFAVDTDIAAEYRKVIETRCVSCHEAGRIEQALAEGRNVDEIVDKMIRMGAQLSSHERDVLGIYWKAEQQQKK